MWVTVFICVTLLFVKSDGNYFRVEDMCEEEEGSKDFNESYKDCSFQIKDAEEGSCRIYNTSVCKMFDFSKWTSEPIKRISNQTDAVFTALVEAYLLEFLVFPKGSYNAFNITLSSTNKDVNGFLVLITPISEQETTDFEHLNICRIFDFKKYSVAKRNQVTLFFDCIYLATENKIKSYNFNFRAFPMNEELQYGILLPDGIEKQSNDACQWTPLLMVFFGKLEENIVEIKFLEAPRIHNIFAYQVDMISSKEIDKVKYSKHIQAKNKDEVLELSFSDVDQGLYSVIVHPIANNEQQTCDQRKSEIFFVHVPHKLIEGYILPDHQKLKYESNVCSSILCNKTVIFISAILLITIGLIVGILLILWWFFKPGPVTSKPTILLVYSYDCKQHEQVISRFAMFLREKCGIKVSSIYGTGNEDPNKWLVDNYWEADTVVIVISEGVFHKCEKFNNPPMEEGHTWGDRLTPALSLLSGELLSTKRNIPKKKYIKVYFDYSGLHHIPKYLQLITYGETFKLVKEINRFLGHVYNQSPKIKCFGIYPQMLGHNIISSPEMLALIESVKEMKRFLKNNCLCPKRPDSVQFCENEITFLTNENKCFSQKVSAGLEVSNALCPSNSYSITGKECNNDNGKCINNEGYWEHILSKELLLNPSDHYKEDQNSYKDELIAQLHQQILKCNSGHDSIVNESNTLHATL